MLHKNRKIKIKILKEAGLEYANFKIPIYIEGNIGEKFELLSATTYNIEEGKLKKTELDRNKIFDEKKNSLWMDKKFTMPDARVGSIIEVEYKITTPYFFNMGTWEFQKEIPVVYSKLNYKAIPYYTYTYIAVGLKSLDEANSKVLNKEHVFLNAKYKEVEYVFGMKNIPAFKDEEFLTSPRDYMQALNFQLSEMHYISGGSRKIMSTWPQLCDEFLKHPDFGKYIKASEKEGKKVLPALQLNGVSEEEQIKIIVLYIKSMYSWNGSYGKYARENLSSFLKNKTGNAANINLFLIGLLKAAGLEVSPVIISTRNNGAISKSHPFESFFNYVIAMVTINGEEHYIDATDPLLYFNQLPGLCVNVEGLVIKPKTEEWTTIYQKETSLLEKDFEIKITPEERKLEVNCIYTASGNEAYQYRKRKARSTDSLSEYLKKNNNIDVTGDIQIMNAEEPDKPFKFLFNFDTSTEGTDTKLFINPFCGIALPYNPFKQNERSSPVDLMFLIGERYISTIEIPEGYAIEFLPKSRNISNNILSFNYDIEEKDNKIIINSGYFFNKVIYAPAEYDPLKTLMALIVDKLSEKIVLTKATSGNQ